MGYLDKAELILNSLNLYINDRDLLPLSKLLMLIHQIIHAWHRADYQTCLKRAQEGLRLSESTGIHIMDIHILTNWAAGALSEGDLKQAERILDQTFQNLDKSRSTIVAYVYYLSGWKSLLKGEVGRALSEAEEAYDLVCQAGAPLQQGVVLVALARIRFEMGEYHQAEEYLGKAREIAYSTGSADIEYPCLLTKTLLALSRGEEEDALGLLRQAFRLGRERNLINYVWWHPKDMIRLCLKALENGIEVGWVQGLIRKRNLIPDSPPLECEVWPWKIKIYTLGRFSILKEGRPLRSGRKAQRRPLDLLKAIIVLGGREIGEQRLAELLWPENEGDKAHQALLTALNRLRRLIGKDAICRKEGRLTVNDHYCWVDIWAIERLFAQIEGIKEEDPSIGIKIDKIFSLIKGPFLRGEAEAWWAVSLRERIRMRFLRLIEKRGRYLIDSKRYECALILYQKGIEVDDLLEGFYQGLMVCYLALGRHSDACSAYQRCKKILITHLGIEPSPKTVEIYNSLIK